MDKELDYRELIAKASVGALGGFIGWFPIEVAAQGLSFLEPHQPQGINFAVCIYAGLVGGLINAPLGRSGAKSAFWQFVRTFLLCAFLLSLRQEGKRSNLEEKTVCRHTQTPPILCGASR